MVFLLVFLLGFFVAHAFVWVAVPPLLALIAVCILWIIIPYVLVLESS